MGLKVELKLRTKLTHTLATNPHTAPSLAYMKRELTHPLCLHTASSTLKNDPNTLTAFDANRRSKY